MPISGKKLYFFILYLVLLPFIAWSQSTTIDSLQKILQSNYAHDSIKISALIELAWEYESSDPQKALKYATEATIKSSKINYLRGLGDASSVSGIIYGNLYDYKKSLQFHYKALEIREKINDKKGIASSCNNIGSVFSFMGDKNKAIEYYQRSLNTSEAIDDKIGMASSLNNMGLLYYDLGEYAKSLGCHLKSLKIREELDDKYGISQSLFNMGLIYESQNEFDKALDVYNQSFHIKNKLNDKQGVSNCFDNIGSVYKNKREFQKSLEYYNKALLIREEIKDQSGIIGTLNNIGSLYNDLGDDASNKKSTNSSEYYSKALQYYTKALNLLSETNDKLALASTLFNIGCINKKRGQYEETLNYFDKAISISKAIGANELLKNIYKTASETYGEMGVFEKAYKFHLLYSNLKDSMYASENMKLFKEMQVKFETEKKEKENQLLKKDNELKMSELNRSRTITYSITVGLLLVVILLIVIYKGYTQKQKANKLLKEQNAEIERQKEEISTQRDALELLNIDLSAQKEEITKQKNEIENKNNKITASIKYAKLIQEALLPSTETIRQCFPEFFVLFIPKDIVSGDFYWVEKVGNKSFFAAVDCTGHGVPGALMSIVGSNLLNQAVNEHHIDKPYEILNFLCHGISYSIRKNEEDPLVKDGMDLTLGAFNRDTYLLEFAGVHNPLYIIRKNGELIEFRTDNHQIGAGFDENFTSYTDFSFQLEPGDNIYSFSDGYIDQFHHETTKKFSTKKFKQTLIGISHLSMDEQKAKLVEIFTDWKGDSEQIDDVLVFGIKV